MNMQQNVHKWKLEHILPPLREAGKARTRKSHSSVAEPCVQEVLCSPPIASPGKTRRSSSSKPHREPLSVSVDNPKLDGTNCLTQDKAASFVLIFLAKGRRKGRWGGGCHSNRLAWNEQQELAWSGSFLLARDDTEEESSPGNHQQKINQG